MKTPEQNKKNLPEELDTELKQLSNEDVAGLEEVWNLASAPAPSNFPNPDRLGDIWASIESKTAEGRSGEYNKVPARAADRPPIKQKKRSHTKQFRWAMATFVALFVIAAGIYFTPSTVTAPLGETASVQLNDGSHVELNSGSSLRFSRRFGQKRTVFLEGEAYFDVIKEDRPFIVETFNSSVQVLGTTFNVKAWNQDDNTVVALRSGSVRVEELGTQEAVTLVPGQTVRVDINDMALSEPDEALVSSSLAWRSGDFSFSEERLITILHDIERRFNMTITLADESIGSKRTKYSRKNPESAEVVIEELCISLGLMHRISEDGIEIYIPE